MRQWVSTATVEIKLQGSPGFPLSSSFATNDGAFSACREELVDAATDRILALCQLVSDIDPDVNINPLQGVREGFTDPVSPFVKQEPHPMRKRGRERIVFGISLVDQLVELALTGRLIRAYKDLYPAKSGALVGIGFSPSHVKLICNAVLTMLNRWKGRALYEEDVSGWDRTFSQERLSAVVRNWCSALPDGGAKHTSFRRLLQRRQSLIQNPLYAISDNSGTHLYSRAFPGGMPSGTRWVTIGNGQGRLLSFFETGALDGYVNGDDGLSIREAGSNPVEAYSRLGLTSRDLRMVTGDAFNFCSHLFDVRTETAYLTSWRKALYRFATRKVDHEEYKNFVEEMKNVPVEEELVEMAHDIVTLRNLPKDSLLPDAIRPVLSRAKIDQQDFN